MATPLDDFFQKHDWELLRKINGWAVDRREELVFLELSARDNARYRVKFVCDDYPMKAPTTAFVNGENSQQDPTAWPKGNQAFHEVVKPPPDCFLCMPLTREGLQHHGDWITNTGVDSWNANKHTLMDLFNYLQRLLNSDDYLRRGP